MTLEAIEKVTEAETRSRERKAAAIVRAKEITAEAQKSGEQLLEQVQSQAAERRKALFLAAEREADARAQVLRQETEKNGLVLKETADAHRKEAVEQIIGGIVEEKWQLSE